MTPVRKPFRVAVRTLDLEAPTPAPATDPLGKAKAAWQPTLRWCKKELRQTLIDPAVKTAVQEFQAKVSAVLDARDADAFHEAQREAAGAATAHEFLRWAPVPSPLPAVQ